MRRALLKAHGVIGSRYLPYWSPCCERLSRGIDRGQRAELEVVSLDLGDHLVAKWLPITGLVYEPKTDMLKVALEGVDHLVARPREVLIETSKRGIVGIEIVADDDVRRIVRLLEPLSLRRQKAGAGTERR